MSELDTSYALCQRLAKRAASNFYFSFLLLPREKRRAMCALYAFLRKIDHLADDDQRDAGARRQSLDAFRGALNNPAMTPPDPIFPAVLDTVVRFGIPPEYLAAAIDGVEMDLAGTRFETLAELEHYCYRVASVVGLACIHIWGFRDQRALRPARDCGVAFQLTNILRDLKEDADRGRVYLPREDLSRFGYTVEELERGAVNNRFRELLEFEIARAERYYDSAAELESYLDRHGSRVFRAMRSTYRGVLNKIKRDPGAVFRRRVRLGAWEKLKIAAQAVAQPRATAARSTCEAASP